MLRGIVAGRYQILEEVGEGGMGVVYRALDPDLNRQVAIKAIHPSLLSHPQSVARLKREALINAALDHPYLCRVYELLEVEGNSLVVMEFVEGETLARRLKGRPLSIKEALRWSRELAEALAAAHAKGLIHRDIKPANIMITPHHHIKLMDFGLAKSLSVKRDPSSPMMTELTQIGSVIGTPHYMPPEQARGERVDEKSDIFALGVVAYECLEGRLPFSGSGRGEYLRRLARDKPEPMAKEIPPALRELIGRCLLKQPSERPASAEVVEQLMSLEESQFAGAPTPAQRADPLIILATAVVVVLIGALAIGRWGTSSPPWDPSMPPRPAALITWPSEDVESRISPDNQWIAFLSDRNGQRDIWLRRRGEEGANPIHFQTEVSRIYGLSWSPEGDRLAVLVRRQEGVILHIIPAFFGGVPHSSTVIATSDFAPRLIRWLPGGIYLIFESAGEGSRRLWKMDVESRQLQPIAQTLRFARVSDVDISRDEKRIVFSAEEEGRRDLWSADIQGEGRQRITDDSFRQASPRFAGGGGSIFYLSNRTGQPDIWQVDLKGQHTRQITATPDEETIEDVSADGGVLTYRVTREEANLWALDPSGLGTRQLTADTMTDFWPSTSHRIPALLAFQRANAMRRPELASWFDTRILLGRLENAAFTEVSVIQSNGFAAKLSPDGEWLAFLRHTDSSRQRGLQCAEQRLLHLESRRSWLLAPCLQLANLSPFPLSWESESSVWHPDSSQLYLIVIGEDGSPAITRCSVGADVQCAAARTGDPSETFSDLHTSGDGRLLAYLSQNDVTNQWRLQLLNTTSGQVATLFDSMEGSYSIKGWSARGQLVLLRSGRSPIAAGVEVVEIGNEGSQRVIGEVADATRFNSSLDLAGTRLFITRQPGVVQNIYSLSLRDNQLTRLTNNELPHLGYSGIRVAPDGSLLYSVHTRNRDIWYCQLTADAASGLP